MERHCLVKWDMSSHNREDAISELLDEFSFQRTTKQLLQTALETRETAEPTIVHKGLCMPHCRSILVDEFMIILGRSRKGIPWPDDTVNLIILFITPVKPTGPSEHMELIKHLAQALRSGGAEELLSAGSPAEAASILDFRYEGINTDE